MRNDFCAFILTHGRPDNVKTWDTLQKAGFTYPVYIVIDDEDAKADEYRERFGDRVIQFCKAEVAKTFDEMDNFDDRRAIVYARNVCHSLAVELGYRFYVQLDDDYTKFEYRATSRLEKQWRKVNKTLNGVFECLIEYLESAKRMRTIALSQGGDFIGGGPSIVCQLKRKAMNSFIGDTGRPLSFIGRINEDVNTYTALGRQGVLFFTTMQANLQQKQTQAHSGGMTSIYLDSGTYVKSFYSVMATPSAVQIGVLHDSRGQSSRIHHSINWRCVSPMILSQTQRRRHVEA